MPRQPLPTWTRALEACKCSRRFAPEEIITKDWARLSPMPTLHSHCRPAACRQASCEKLHFDEHEGLQLSVLSGAAPDAAAAAGRLPTTCLRMPACGHVLRVKGFAPDPQGTTGWLELNATAAGQTLAPIPQGQDVLIVIGEGLDRARIETQLHR